MTDKPLERERELGWRVGLRRDQEHRQCIGEVVRRGHPLESSVAGSRLMFIGMLNKLGPLQLFFWLLLSSELLSSTLLKPSSL
jgi:hypothetical protein